MNKVTTQQYDELLEILENGWGDEEEVLDALIEFVGDYNVVREVLTKDLTFNRYTCDICGWIDLAWSILLDECFEDELDTPFFKELRYNINNEDKLKQMLTEQNWAISIDHSVAIGFDDSVKVINNEVNKDNF